MLACGLLGVAAATLLNLCAAPAADPTPAPGTPDVATPTSDRPLYQLADPAAGAQPKAEQESFRTAPLPAAALMGIGMIGGMMITAAIKRRKQ